VPVSLSSEDNYAISEAALRDKITPNTKAILINTPCNPSGRVLSEQEIESLCAVATEADLYVIADEIYEKIIFDNHVHRSLGGLPDMTDRTITVNGFSKGYAMTGWRLGWLAGPTPILKLAARLHTQTITSAATFTMHAGVAALNGPQDMVAAMTRAYQDRRDFMVGALNQIDGIRCRSIDGAFYLFPSFPNSSKNSLELAEAILDKAEVAGVPGSAFGSSGEGHVRFSIATSMHDLERAVERLARVAPEL
jgi:aspartate aminotransferase